MCNRFHKIWITAFILAVIGIVELGSMQALRAEEKLQIVTSTALFRDLVQKIGGEKVEAKHIASPKFNVHFVQPRPNDVKNTAKADLFVFAGLDLEAWVDPLLEAAGKPALFRGGTRNVDLSQNIYLLNPPISPLSREQGDLHLFGNPHYHMNPANLKIASGTLLQKLQEIDPMNASYYSANAESFRRQLDNKISEWQQLCAHCGGQEVISYHDDMAYLADFLGLQINQFIEPKPGVPPTPKHLQFLQKYVKENNVRAIVMPTYFPQKAAKVLADSVGAKVVTVCQNAGEVEGTEDLFEFFDHNIQQISVALRVPTPGAGL